jgi:hypothetical protein
MSIERFATEEQARKFARKMSNDGVARYVIESPPKPDEPIDAELRFVVDTDGFTRSWERSIAVYEDGKAQP